MRRTAQTIKMKKSMSSFMDASLTRAEMKTLMGGFSNCKTGPCRLYVQIHPGEYVKRDGHCTGEGSGVFKHCYCETGLGNMTLQGGATSNCTGFSW